MFMKPLSLSALSAGVLYLSSLSSTVLLSEPAWAAGPTYTPPQVGAPNRRVGGGTRSMGDGTNAPFVAVLSPQSTGYTQNAQPTLYWAISKTVHYPIEIMLVETNPASLDAMHPVLEQKVSVSSAGLQSLSLAEMGIKLKPGVEYEWFVSIIRNPASRSDDVVTSGVLKYIEPGQEPKITSCLDQASQQSQYSNYAQCGLWYDAIHALVSQRGQQPENGSLKAAQVSLLNQVELPQVAALIQ